MIPTPNDHDVDLQPLRLRLSQLRNARGWSFDEMAARSGLGRATVVSLESGAQRQRAGRTGPPASGNLTTWYRIAHAFDMNLSDLLAVLDDHPND